MAKCQKCGRKGLFLKLDNHLLCNECAALKKREDEAAAIREKESAALKKHEEEVAAIHTKERAALKKREEEAEAISKRAENAEAFLNEALRNAKTQAQRILEAQEKALREKVKELEPCVSELEEQRDELSGQIDGMKKTIDSLDYRIRNKKELYKSMKYVMDNFVDTEFVNYVWNINWDKIKERIAYVSEENFDSEPDLKCYSIKSLRDAFRKNQKQIETVKAAYESRYKTQTLVSLYKLMVMALSAELNVILGNLSYGKLDDALNRVKAMTAQCYSIASNGNETIKNTLYKFIGQMEYLYSNAVKIEYEYYVKRERAKEEQRALREQMRQEAEERKALEAEKKKVEAEEKKYIQEMERIQAKLNQAYEADEIRRLKERIRELTDMMNSIAEKKEEIIKLQNGKAGTVYIISNVGSFGKNVFKIGMTRRLEPQDRVNELGSASVPFPFDVHSFIFSEDAPALETALHKELNSCRVNKVNLRKEFFHTTLDELEALVERIDPDAPFVRTMLAEQYHQSLSIGEPMDTMDDVEWDE